MAATPPHMGWGKYLRPVKLLLVRYGKDERPATSVNQWAGFFDCGAEGSKGDRGCGGGDAGFSREMAGSLAGSNWERSARPKTTPGNKAHSAASQDLRVRLAIEPVVQDGAAKVMPTVHSSAGVKRTWLMSQARSIPLKRPTATGDCRRGSPGLPFVEKGLTPEFDWNSLRWNCGRIVPRFDILPQTKAGQLIGPNIVVNVANSQLTLSH